MNDDRCRRDDVAAWLLGALPPYEAREVERHVASCEECQLTAADLRPVLAALPESAPPADPPPELRRRVMAAVREEERRRRPQRAPVRRWLRPAPVLAALAVGLAGLAAGLAVTGGGDPGRTVEATVAAEGGRAALVVEGGSATLRVAGLPSLPPSRVYQVWVKRPGREPAPTNALFDVDRRGRASVAVPADPEGVEAVLVTAEPHGGSRTPSGAPVVVAPL